MCSALRFPGPVLVASAASLFEQAEPGRSATDEGASKRSLFNSVSSWVPA